ncbi:hypothetical protein GN244_ATG03225 [Phytophthora infestans]|uniref:PH domain-containing protein n=1 Tax=Phytophthora infestans TaxID=4787 RepID=A0A833TPK5_PHYIN|nr:hypothetical protein GN244_ATG18762 [Phytophthora infestans]KAF4044336.1 hypothetical protein GN244_ATG03225 [Phytophthora infestans]KAF4147662.1 hypothetical protein GN958_ATG03017 [Phytophthora infestans]
MKALAHRLRGRRASRRGDRLVDEEERSFRFEEAVKDDVRPKRAPSDQPTTAQERRRDDNWRKNRGINSKTGSCNALAALASVSTHHPDNADVVPPSFVNSPPLEQPKVGSQGRTASAPSMARVDSPQQQQRLDSNSRVSKATVAAASRSNSRQTDDQFICKSTSSSSSHSQNSNSSVGRRTRSRHGGSISSNASFLSVSTQKPEVAVDVRHSGYLMIKRGLLKVADKRYYFVARRHPELYSCKDETSFNLWLASGHPLDPHGGDAIAKASGLSPVLVGTVLRADGSSGEGGSHQSDKVFTVMIGSTAKCITVRLAAKNSEKATQWLEALQEVQVTQRESSRPTSKLGSAMDKQVLLSLDEHNALRGADSIPVLEESNSDHSSTDVENMKSEAVLVIDDASGDREPVATRPTSTSNAKMPRVYTGGKLQSKLRTEDDEATAVSTPSSRAGSSPPSTSEQMDYPSSAQTLPPSRLHRMDSVTSSSSTTSRQSQSSNSNVLLFVPEAGSSLTVSASRLAKAQQELDALVAKGAKLPSRVMLSLRNGEVIEWRYGAPEYVLTDLAYVRGRIREPDTTPLASYVEECCHTFIMEATHKARYDQWRSVVQESFYLQVNDGIQVLGSSILENDMLGLLYLGDAEATMGADRGGSDESHDPRAELAEAFPDGFPMEVLDVFTQPPQCYFSWRHWGPFTGKYRGIKGDGSKVEVRGFGEMAVDASRMRSLRLFFKQKDLVSGLRQVTDRVARARRDTATISALNAAPGRMVRAASAAVAPVSRKESTPTPKTREIIEGLANFTIEAKEQQRKQTR